MTDSQITSQVMEDLKRIREDALERMEIASDRDYSSLAKVVVDVNERMAAFGESGQSRETGLSQFMDRLAEKQAARGA